MEVTLDPENRHEASLAIIGVLSEVKFNRFHVVGKGLSGLKQGFRAGAQGQFRPRDWSVSGLDALRVRADIHQAVTDLQQLGDAPTELIFGAEFHSAQAVVDAAPRRPSSWLDSYSGGRIPPAQYLPHGTERCARFEHATAILSLEGPDGSLSSHPNLHDLASLVVEYPTTELMWILIKPCRSISATGRAERPSYDAVFKALSDVLQPHPAIFSGGVTYTVLDPWHTHSNESHVAGTVSLAGARVTKLLYHRLSLDEALSAIAAKTG